MGKASKNLFDDDDASTGVEEGGLNFGVNTEYAARLEVGLYANQATHGC